MSKLDYERLFYKIYGRYPTSKELAKFILLDYKKLI